MPDEQDPDTFSLVMPFVVCASNGGPYEDLAYVAGYEMGYLSGRLEQKPAAHQQVVRKANVPQVDLVAMDRGYKLKVVEMPEWDSDDWVNVLLVQTALKIEPDDGNMNL